MRRRILIAASFLIALTVARTLSAQEVEFTQITSAIDSGHVELTRVEEHRLERIFRRVFPARLMSRVEHTRERPVTRRVTYSVFSMRGHRYVIAGYAARWEQPVDLVAIYRLDYGWPIQVWRSEPWEASYFGFNFQTCEVGPHGLVLFQEGSAVEQFGIASTVLAIPTRRGLYLRDVTPYSGALSARIRFPFRTLYGQNIRLQAGENSEAGPLLSVSDQPYRVSANYVQPTQYWRFNVRRRRFEPTSESARGEVSLR